MSLQFSGFRVKARHLGRERVYVSSILLFFFYISYFCFILPMMKHNAKTMDAPTEVTRWDGGTYRSISIAFVILRGQAPLNFWTCSSLENYAFGALFPHTICLSSLLSLLIITQTQIFLYFFERSCCLVIVCKR